MNLWFGGSKPRIRELGKERNKLCINDWRKTKQF